MKSSTPVRRRRLRASEILMKTMVWILLVCFLAGSLGIVLVLAR